MGAADFILIALLGVADAALMTHLRRRRSRRARTERILRSLRTAVQRQLLAGCVVPG